MKRKTALVLLLLTMTLCLLLLAGCGDPAAVSEDPENTESSAAKVENPDYVSFTAANVPLLDPATAFDEAASYYLCNVYDPLVWPDHDGSIIPWVATEWSASEDGLVWTFTIRNDVTFHNGETLTAGDVAYSMNRLTTIGQGFAYLFNAVNRAEAADDSTVVFYLNEPFANFANCLVRLYIVDESQIKEHQQEGTYADNGDYGMNWLLAADAGSGPYCFEELSGESYVMGKKYENYWAGFRDNVPGGFKLIGSTEAVTVMTMMSRQELEVSDCYQTLEALANLDAQEGVDLTNFNSGGQTFMILNNQKAPTDCEHFRKALAYMVDYTNLVATLYPNSTVAQDLVNSCLPGYTAANWPYYFDLDKAQAELEQSKYYDQLGDYTVEAYWDEACVEREQFLLVLQSVAAQFGIEMKITQMTFTQLCENATSVESTPNTAVLWCTPDYLEAGSMLNAQWTIQTVGSWYTMDWVNDPEIDALIKASLVELDEATRIDMYKQAITMLIDRCATVPLAEMYETHAYQTEYFYWEVADRVSQGLEVCPVMGYIMDVKNMEVYPDKR